MLETRQGLKVHNPVLQKTNVLRMTVDAVVRHLPLLPEDHVVLLDGIFDGIGHCHTGGEGAWKPTKTS